MFIVGWNALDGDDGLIKFKLNGPLNFKIIVYNLIVVQFALDIGQAEVAAVLVYGQVLAHHLPPEPTPPQRYFPPNHQLFLFNLNYAKVVLLKIYNQVTPAFNHPP